MMCGKSIACVMGSLLLAGCVLQSAEPNFKEQQGSTLPKNLGSTFTSESLIDGVWKAEEGTISFKPAGKHYVASNSTAKSTIDVLFVKLGSSSWVMQAAEKDKPTAYVLAEAKEGQLLIQPLLCDDLKKAPKAEKLVRFDGMDCFLEAKGDLATFKSLKALVPPARLRLVPVK